jgi:hypothetical protein
MRKAAGELAVPVRRSDQHAPFQLHRSMIQSDKAGADLVELATSETMQLSSCDGTAINVPANGTTAAGVCLVIRH